LAGTEIKKVAGWHVQRPEEELTGKKCLNVKILLD
jgi:hypothetical protein